MLHSVKMICRRTNTKLASRWELADIIGLLAGGKIDASGKRKSDISGKTAEKYSGSRAVVLEHGDGIVPGVLQ